MITATKILLYVSAFSSLIPLFLMIVRFHGLRDSYFTLLSLLLSISFIADITGSLLTISFNGALPYITNIQDMGQFILLLLIYHKFYLEEKRVILALVTLIYFGFEITNSLAAQGFGEYQTWTWSLNSFIFICISIGYFIYQLKELPQIDLTRYAPTWINAGVLFYFGFSLSIFLISQYAFNNLTSDSRTIFWSFHNFINLVKNALFTVGIYIGTKKAKPDYYNY